MRRLVAAISIAAASAALAVPAAARLVGPGVGKSWGKAGISFDQYRSDAVTCGRRAAGTDLRGSDPADALVVASRMIDNGNSGSSAAAMMAQGVPPDVVDLAGPAIDVARINPELQIDKAADILRTTLDQCLIARGYRHFRLTAQQMHRLGKLPSGSDARHHYLYDLASNPEILARQGVEERE